MLERKRIVEELSVYFSVLQYYIRTNSKKGRIDINIISEDLVACILNVLRGWDLKNTNSCKPNSPAIDLLDSYNRIGIQVTSKCDSKKINNTIKVLSESEMKDNVSELFIFSLVPRQKKYLIKNECSGVKFSESNIWDFDFVIRDAEFQSTDADTLEKLHKVVLKSFSDWPKKIIQTVNALHEFTNSSEKLLIDELLKELLERSFITGESAKAKIILLIEKNEIVEAKSLLDELANARTKLAAKELMDIANLYSLLSSDKADVFYAKAINLNPNSVKDANIHAISLMHRGLLSEAKGIFKACLDRDSLSLLEHEAILGNLGFLYKNNAEYKESIECFQEAISLSEKNNNIIGKIKHLNGLGSCYLNIEEYDMSGRYFDQAKVILNEVLNATDSLLEKNELRLVKSNLLTNIAIRMKNLSIINEDEGLLFLAKDTLEQAIDLADMMNDKRSLMRHYGNIANVFRLLDRNNESRDYNKRSYELASELEDKRSKIVCILNEGILDMQEGFLISARDKFKMGIHDCGEVYPKLYANLNANCALVYKKLNKYSEAYTHFKIAEQEYVKYGMNRSLELLNDNLSKI